VNANQANLPVRTMCRMLGVSHSGFYAWQERAPSPRAIEDAVLTERIRMIHAASDENYGSPNIHAELPDEGTRVGRKRVARLMRLASIRGTSRCRSLVVTTRRDARQRPAPDLVKREFVAVGPNRLWVADMTYVPTRTGFIYLAIRTRCMESAHRRLGDRGADDYRSGARRAEHGHCAAAAD
jgi:putative transposase